MAFLQQILKAFCAKTFANVNSALEPKLANLSSWSIFVDDDSAEFHWSCRFQPENNQQRYSQKLIATILSRGCLNGEI
jgi:hypothetical protein